MNNKRRAKNITTSGKSSYDIILNDFNSNHHIAAEKHLTGKSSNLAPNELFDLFEKGCEKGWTDFIKILLKEQPQYVTTFISANPPPLNPKTNYSVLEHAINKGYLDLLNLLLSYKPPVNLSNGHGTPLFIAASSDIDPSTKLKIITALIKAGANPNLNGRRNNVTPLFVSCMRGENNIAEYLLNAGSNPNAISTEIDDEKSQQTPLFKAIYTHNDKLVEILIKHKADINQSIDFRPDNSKEPKSQVPLVLACGLPVKNIVEEQKNIKIVELLLTNGANTKNRSIHEATGSGKLQVVKTLISKNVPVNISIKNTGVTPLYLSCDRNHTELFNTLIPHADLLSINQATTSGDTPLLRACYNNNYEIVKQLIEKGANVNYSNPNGFTALYYACYTNNYELINLLIQKGANLKTIYQLNNIGTVGNALSISILNKDYQTAQLLIEKGSPVYLVNTSAHYQPIIHALYSGKNGEQIALMMLARIHNPAEFKALTVVIKNITLTPLSIAMRAGTVNTVKMLVEHPYASPPTPEELLLNACNSADTFNFIYNKYIVFFDAELLNRYKHYVQAAFMDNIVLGNYEVAREYLNKTKLLDLITTEKENLLSLLHVLFSKECSEQSLKFFDTLLLLKNTNIQSLFDDIENSPLLTAIASGNLGYFKMYFENKDLDENARKYYLSVAVSYRQADFVDYLNEKCNLNFKINEESLARLDDDEKSEDNPFSEFPNSNFQSDITLFNNDPSQKALQDIGLNKRNYKKILDKHYRDRETIEKLTDKSLSMNQLFESGPSWGADSIRKNKTIKIVEGAENWFLYTPEEIRLTLKKEKKSQEFYTCLNSPRKSSKINEFGYKFLDSSLQVKVKLGSKIAECKLIEAKQLHDSARLLCIAFPSDSNKKGEQGILIVPVLFLKKGLHSEGDIKALLDSINVKMKTEYVFDITPKTMTPQPYIKPNQQ